MNVRLIIITLLAIGSILPAVVHADSSFNADPTPTPPDTVGSAASFDKRLPPVLPGEEIVRNGKTMKVWSSSGPVTVQSVPEPGIPGTLPQQPLNGLGGVGVIVDQRQNGQGR